MFPLHVSIEYFVLWPLAALGIYYLLYLADKALRRRSFRTSDLRDSSNQLRYVMQAEFAAKKVMSLAEYRVFKATEDEIRANYRGFRVFSQTSLGEILSSSDGRAFSSINSKRVDVLVLAPGGLPVVAIEFQGQGHYQGDAAARDAVKKEALRKAGVKYVEIFDNHSDADIRRLVVEAMAQTTSASRSRLVRAL
jgi:hypothetical protein